MWKEIFRNLSPTVGFRIIDIIVNHSRTVIGSAVVKAQGGYSTNSYVAFISRPCVTVKRDCVCASTIPTKAQFTCAENGIPVW